MKRVKYVPYFSTANIPVADLTTSDKFRVHYPKQKYGGRGGKASRDIVNARVISGHLILTEPFYFKPGTRVTVDMPDLHLREVYICERPPNT